MTQLLHELLLHQAMASPDLQALVHRSQGLAYGVLAEQVEKISTGLLALGLGRQERVAIALPKQFETVTAIFATLRAGCVFVPVNPVLKSAQVEHILRDCNVRVLVTGNARLQELGPILENCPDLHSVVLVDTHESDVLAPPRIRIIAWSAVLSFSASPKPHRNIDADMAAILYTSGSTGKPKGVVLSHKNMVTGAASVAQYLSNTSSDRLLAVLPFSFDYGFSQLSTAFRVGASVVLMDYLLPRDVINAVNRERITGLAGVPPLWSQLAELQWPPTITEHLRYITNSGGAMPGAVLSKLRQALPKTQPFLMYGLTEAFRSTYLPPAEVDRRPDSMGKAIPNAEILVVRPDGSPCAANEPGELVHRGSLVALGYWNDAAKTNERFKPAPNQNPGLMLTEMAVWSGDTVRMDEDGFLYFIGRRDEMIKTSGYRVSPTEIEEVIFATRLVADVAAVGVPHPVLGQAIVIVATAPAGTTPQEAALLDACRRQLPQYMAPQHVQWRESLPRNPNGKYDRPKLALELKNLFTDNRA